MARRRRKKQKQGSNRYRRDGMDAPSEASSPCEGETTASSPEGCLIPSWCTRESDQDAYLNNPGNFAKTTVELSGMAYDCDGVTYTTTGRFRGTPAPPQQDPPRCQLFTVWPGIPTVLAELPGICNSPEEDSYEIMVAN